MSWKEITERILASCPLHKKTCYKCQTGIRGLNQKCRSRLQITTVLFSFSKLLTDQSTDQWTGNLISTLVRIILFKQIRIGSRLYIFWELINKRDASTKRLSHLYLLSILWLFVPGQNAFLSQASDNGRKNKTPRYNYTEQRASQLSSFHFVAQELQGPSRGELCSSCSKVRVWFHSWRPYRSKSGFCNQVLCRYFGITTLRKILFRLAIDVIANSGML